MFVHVTEFADLPGRSVAPSSSHQGLVDCKPGGVDIFVVETPSPNAVAEPSGIVGAGGLGEGTPKVVPIFFPYLNDLVVDHYICTLSLLNHFFFK